jgi:uncharacterized protein YbjT (DUF2867 family)
MADSMRYLVTGATGNVGSLVVERLFERGVRPRIFVRDADKARGLYADRVDTFVGDLADTASLASALRGTDAVFLVNSGPGLEARDEAAATAAKAAGVRRLVKLSSMDAEGNIGTGVWHARGEAAIRASGVAFTFVQPSGFMSNVLFWARSIKAEGIVRSATGDGRIPFIHPRDIADVSAAALTTERYEGESLPITGPQALSYAEMTARIAARIGRSLTYVSVSDDAALQPQIAAGESPPMVDAHRSIYRAIREGRLATVTGDVERVLGRRPISFDAWVEENAGAFR